MIGKIHPRRPRGSRNDGGKIGEEKDFSLSPIDYPWVSEDGKNRE